MVGVDAAADMIAAARKRGLDARVVDGGKLEFSREFDAVFSNAALHWMKRRSRRGDRRESHRALKPGGRFVAEMGGHGCVAAITVALIAVLERHGIKDGAATIPGISDG